MTIVSIFIDNGSQDGTLDYLKALQSLYPKIKILEIERNMGVAVASNLGWVQEETSPYYLKLDNDIEILDPEWLKKLLNYQKTNPQVGLVGYHFLEKH
ncbi:MAG: glycosyltransferase [Desulfovibrionaceae bacterium]|nr:glycosyltransferase [Desulfovibrionaceae bacterium]